MNTKKLYISLFLTCFIFQSCTEWLDVSPKTQVKQEDLFTTEEGFKSALTGIYDRMAIPNLYGQQLTFDYIEKLVQRYDNYAPGEVSTADRAVRYDYKNNSASKNRLANIWREQYTTIANINNILENLDKDGSVVKNTSIYPYLKGESLGLRAYIHFDLLRMWGPVYSENPELKSIIWRDKLNSDKQTLLEANKVIEKIITDLKEAEELLNDDEMAWDTKSNTNSFLDFRRYRMNKYAVKGLLARVYLWIGDKENAYKYANDVINNSGIGLITDNRVDPALFKEQLFSLYIYNQEEKLISIFPSSVGVLSGNTPNSVLWISQRNANEVFETTSIGINDIRYKNRQGFLFGANKGLLRKYMTLAEAKTNDNRPMIRLSEMYYIRAETGTLLQSTIDINKIRNVRGISREFNVVADNNYTETTRIELLNKEYQKEFFGEGQWFFFLKRNNIEKFYRSPLEDDDSMRNYYIFPIPDDEKEHGLGARE